VLITGDAIAKPRDVIHYLAGTSRSIAKGPSGGNRNMQILADRRARRTVDRRGR
jgi:hypothetical protein